MWTTTDLLDTVRERAMIPDDGPISGEDILTFATEELHTQVLPVVLAMRSDYGIVRESMDIEVGQAEYPIPHRAVGGKLRALKKTRASGEVVTVPIYSLEQTEELSTGGAYIEGDSVYLVPTPTEAETLTMVYYVRPGALGLFDDCASNVTNISVAGGGEITVTHSNASMSVGSEGFDVYNSKPNFGLKAVGVEPVSVVDPNNVILPAGTKVAIGDIISTSNFTHIPNVPAEAHSFLAQLTVVRVLDALGDKDALQEARRKLTDLGGGLNILLATRNDGDSAVIVNRNMLGV
jgi:hypothetical protein